MITIDKSELIKTIDHWINTCRSRIIALEFDNSKRNVELQRLEAIWLMRDLIEMRIVTKPRDPENIRKMKICLNGMKQTDEVLSMLSYIEEQSK